MGPAMRFILYLIEQICETGEMRPNKRIDSERDTISKFRSEIGNDGSQ